MARTKKKRKSVNLRGSAANKMMKFNYDNILDVTKNMLVYNCMEYGKEAASQKTRLAFLKEFKEKSKALKKDMRYLVFNLNIFDAIFFEKKTVEIDEANIDTLFDEVDKILEKHFMIIEKNDLNGKIKAGRPPPIKRLSYILYFHLLILENSRKHLNLYRDFIRPGGALQKAYDKNNDELSFDSLHLPLPSYEKYWERGPKQNLKKSAYEYLSYMYPNESSSNLEKKLQQQIEEFLIKYGLHK